MELTYNVLFYVSIFISFLIPFTIHFLISKKNNLPPGPFSIPLFGNLLWLRNSISDRESILRDLHARLGPIVTLRIGSRTGIYIADRAMAHKALMGHGPTFANRPKSVPFTRFIRNNQHNITSATYGPIWRILRRNLTSEILHPSRLKHYSSARTWVSKILLQDLYNRARASSDGIVVAKDSIQFAIFYLLVVMCFGGELDEKMVRELEVAQRNLFWYVRKLNVLTFFPSISKYIFRNRVKNVTELWKKQRELCLPLIESRKMHKKMQQETTEERYEYSYLDSLLDLKIPDEGMRELTEEEIVSLCSEFLNAGTDTTSIVLHWIMAELTKHPKIQNKLFEEIKDDAARADREIKDDLQKMSYLKAVILEGLRLHPPGHFVLPHGVTEDVELQGYNIPKSASINFMVAEIGRNEKVWKEPMVFRPERFLRGGEGEGVDITGTREIKMMRLVPGGGFVRGLGFLRYIWSILWPFW